MGKLAARLADASRSGVYRVESTAALEEAAALNGFLLLKGPAVAQPEDGRVLLLTAFDAGLLARLEVTAAECRGRGWRFFAVFLDPEGTLPLAPLYNWKRGG
jgi:hypothetical protein